MARRHNLDPDAQEERFSALFREHYRAVLAFARRRVGADAGQEIAAETFLVAWRRFESIPDHALPWLYQVATFTIANYRRREAKEYHPGDGSVQTGPPLDPADEAIEHDHLRTAFAGLSEKDRAILRLAAWEGVNSSDGAAILGCSVTAYKVRLHRARTHLARAIGSPLPALRPEPSLSGFDPGAHLRATEESA